MSDALKCEEVGAKGIVVSNHGGEAIDYSVPILRVLPHIKKAVPNMTIFAESGFQRGSDILKALALGADGCLCPDHPDDCIRRPWPSWGGRYAPSPCG